MSASATLQPTHEKTVIPGVAKLVVLAVVKTAFLLCFAGGFGYYERRALLSRMCCASGMGLRGPAAAAAVADMDRDAHTWLVVWAVRLYPAIAAGATVILTGWLAAELGGGKRAVILASLLAFIDPVTFGFGHILSTNALDLPMWLLCVLLLVKIEKGASPTLWLWWGVTARQPRFGRHLTGLVTPHKRTSGSE